MAVDDNNPSKRPPMNRSANPNPVNGIFEGISSGAGFMSAEHRARLATIAGDASAISDLTSLVDITSGDMNRANLFDQIAKRQTSFNRLTEQVNGSDLQATRRAGREASNFIARSYSSSAMNGEANRWVSDPDVQMRAMGMSSTPWNDLQAGRQNVMNQLGELKRQTREAAQGMYTGRAQIVPEKLEAVNALYQQKATLEKELGVFTAAERYQRGQGLDPTSQTANIGRGVQLANKLLGQSQLSQDIASGGISINRDGQTVKIGTADIGRETINQAGRVQGAQAKLDAAVAQNVPNLQPFNDALKEATAGLTKLHEAAGTVGDSGGAPGSSFARKMGMVSDIAQAASAGFMASSFQQQNINVGIPMQRAANIAGTSAIENQRYQAYKGSQQGDVLSMMMMPEFNRARQFGQEMGEASQEALKTKTSGHGMGWIAGAGALAGGAVIAGGALLSGTGIGSAVGIPVMAAGAKLLALSTGVGAIAGGASYMMGEKANVNVTTAQAEAGTIRGAARVGGAAAYLQAQMAEKQISAEQLQGVVNFGRGLGGVAQGLGGAGGEAYLQSTVGNPAFLKNLTDKRIGMEQFTNLSQQGAGVQGSLFNANQIFTARGLERTGYGSMENTMTNMNLMSRAGSNNPEASWMGQLTTGFTKSLESAAVLREVAQNTAQYATESAFTRQLGGDALKHAGRIMVGSQDPNDPNQVWAAQRAAKSVNSVSGVINNMGMDIASLSWVSKQAKDLGINSTEAMALRNRESPFWLEMSEQASKRGKTPEEDKAIVDKIRNDLVQSGVDAKTMRGKSDDEVRRFAGKWMSNQRSEGAQGGQFGVIMGVSGRDIQAVNNFVSKDKNNLELLGKRLMDAPLEVQDAWGRMAKARQAQNIATGGNLTNEEYYRSLQNMTGQGTKTTKSQQDAQTQMDNARKGEGGSETRKTVDDLMTAGFRQAGEAAQAAADKLGGFSKSLDTVLAAMNEIHDKEGGTGGEANFGKAAAQAATNLDSAAFALNGAASYMKDVLGDIAVQIGSKAKRPPDAPSQAGLTTNGGSDSKGGSSSPGLIKQWANDNLFQPGRGFK